jgi:hypothetical protein
LSRGTAVELARLYLQTYAQKVSVFEASIVCSYEHHQVRSIKYKGTNEASAVCSFLAVQQRVLYTTAFSFFRQEM